MDAADQTGAHGNAEQAVRYIITRPCLAEGSLSLLKYLQPHFPADGELVLLDARGERHTVTVDASRRRLMGLDALYRAHHLGVNDVLMLQRAAEREYSVACVVKPHARPQPGAAERPAPAPPMVEKRVVIHATPHVREVRTERVSAAQISAVPAGGTSASTAPTDNVLAGGSASPSGERPDDRQRAPTTSSGAQPAQAQPTATAIREVAPAAPVDRSGPALQSTPASQHQTAAPLSTLTARLQQGASVRTGTPQPVRMNSAALNMGARHVSPLGAPIQLQFGPARQGQVRPFPQGSPALNLANTPTSAPAQARVRGTVTTGSALQVPATPAAPAVQPTTGTAQSTRSTPAPAEALRSTTDLRPNPEDQLAALARLTGYTCEHLGSGVVRLRAELGQHGYSVLIATTPQALTTPAWNEQCDYMALLTPEDQRPQGIPRFTYAALEALLEHARLAPLTPIDLRGYWNTGSFDQESVESVAELVSAHLAQRGSFSHVLVTLAQQPAHSLVQLPRLAERLGSGVNTSELQSILETLSRPPFLALTPLPGGQYYLRSEVRDLLQEFGEYAEGMRRRLRPAPLAATGR